MESKVRRSDVRPDGDGMEEELLKSTPEIKYAKPTKHRQLTRLNDSQMIRVKPQKTVISKEPVKAAVKEVVQQKPTKTQKNQNTETPQVQNVDTSGSIQSMTAETIDKVREECEGEENSDLDILNEELEATRRELEAQIRINKDLKKLLIASMGDDLHHRVDCLVKDRVALAENIEAYSKRLEEGGLIREELEIRADMYRSKFAASKLLVEEAIDMRASLQLQLNYAHQAMKELLSERAQVRKNLQEAYGVSQATNEALGIERQSKKELPMNSTILEISEKVNNLSLSLKNALLPVMNNSKYQTIPFGFSPTAAEVMAMQCLANRAKELDGSDIRQIYKHNRFHLAANFDNLTLNCCSNCTGKIHAV
ncbi:DgyrCDS8403 [Dimorphilus gyrociliatus]|uniref:DgyrCDS8403 n=1 Tax=Dimorphilus gyrociliatus TaxID=2664684 RepID=A0A7I8VU13_9ANNE|nr:DgyrCDS8403 [Dimorphilus gyrociliatus]